LGGEVNWDNDENERSELTKKRENDDELEKYNNLELGRD